MLLAQLLGQIELSTEAAAAAGKNADAVARDLGRKFAPGRLLSVMNATRQQAPGSLALERQRGSWRTATSKPGTCSQAGGRAAPSRSVAHNVHARRIKWRFGLSRHELSTRNCCAGHYADAANRAWYFAISRDLRRAALFCGLHLCPNRRDPSTLTASMSPPRQQCGLRMQHRDLGLFHERPGFCAQPSCSLRGAARRHGFASSIILS